MYNYNQHSIAYIEKLRKCVDETYEIKITKIETAKRGFFGETWKLFTKDEIFFIKIIFLESQKKIFQNSLCILEYLAKYEINFINKVIRTKSNQLSVRFENGILAMFDFIEGLHIKNYDSCLLYKTISRVYTVPVKNLNIEIEDFNIDCGQYVLNNIKKIPKISDNFTNIQKYFEKLQFFSDQCYSDRDNMYITHGDSAGNVVLTSRQEIKIIDWDTAKIAPPERDVWTYVKRFSDLNIFDKILNSNGIEYSLRKERICFYCYFNYFFYLKEYIIFYFSAIDMKEKRRIQNYIRHFFLEGWIIKYFCEIDNI